MPNGLRPSINPDPKTNIVYNSSHTQMVNKGVCIEYERYVRSEAPELSLRPGYSPVQSYLRRQKNLGDLVSLSSPDRLTLRFLVYMVQGTICGHRWIKTGVLSTKRRVTEPDTWGPSQCVLSRQVGVFSTETRVIEPDTY
jgi:hypothetical protein